MHAVTVRARRDAPCDRAAIRLGGGGAVSPPFDPSVRSFVHQYGSCDRIARQCGVRGVRPDLRPKRSAVAGRDRRDRPRPQWSAVTAVIAVLRRAVPRRCRLGRSFVHTYRSSVRS